MSHNHLSSDSTSIRNNIFSSRGSRFLIILAVGLVLLSVILALYGQKNFDTMTNPLNSYHKGSLGHHAFTELMKRFKVHVNRIHQFKILARAQAPLFFIEPAVAISHRKYKLTEVIARRLKKGYDSIVVLPKWELVLDPISKVKLAKLRSTVQVKLILNKVLPSLKNRLELFRGNLKSNTLVSSKEVFHSYGSIEAKIPIPQRIRLKMNNSLSSESIQLSPSVQVLLGTPDTAFVIRYTPNSEARLVANTKRASVIIVTDPDLLHNFNLQRGEHAVLWWTLARNILQTDTILIDEVFHNLLKTFSLTK